jgi:hypothetical protein
VVALKPPLAPFEACQDQRNDQKTQRKLRRRTPVEHENH